jgi:hypothetical protein
VEVGGEGGEGSRSANLWIEEAGNAVTVGAAPDNGACASRVANVRSVTVRSSLHEVCNEVLSFRHVETCS